MKNYILYIVIIVAAFLVRDGLVKFRSSERIVEVRGLSERVVQSNSAVWIINFSSQGNELQETNDRYQKNQKILIKFFQDLGFKENEIQKSPANIQDNWANSYGDSKPQYKITIRGAVSVTTDRVLDVASAVDKTDKLIELGVVFEGSTVFYKFTDLNSIKPEMVKEATANARESATKFAEHTGASLGKIKSATQGLFSITDENSEYESSLSINKKVRVVTQVSFYID